MDDEPAALREAYGKCSVGEKALLARRLVESGVTFVLVSGAWGYFDNHGDTVLPYLGIEKGLKLLLPGVDRTVHTLVTDLEQRGLLDTTLVIWGGEFGRTPYAEKNGTGRDHNPLGFTVWLAGGGFKAGFAHGETDDIGHMAVDGKVHMHDLHATILHQLGLDHEKLTFRQGGRDFRLTDVHGHVVKEIVT